MLSLGITVRIKQLDEKEELKEPYSILTSMEQRLYDLLHPICGPTASQEHLSVSVSRVACIVQIFFYAANDVTLTAETVTRSSGPDQQQKLSNIMITICNHRGSLALCLPVDGDDIAEALAKTTRELVAGMADLSRDMAKRRRTWYLSQRKSGWLQKAFITLQRQGKKMTQAVMGRDQSVTDVEIKGFRVLIPLEKSSIRLLQQQRSLKLNPAKSGTLSLRCTG